MGYSAVLEPAADHERWTLAPGDLVCVSTTDDVHDVLRSMRRHRLRRAVVIEPGGRFVAVVEHTDLIPFDRLQGPHRLGEVVAACSGSTMYQPWDWTDAVR